MEFGIVLSETAMKRKLGFSPDIVRRAESIFINEVKTNGLEKTACQFVPLILAALEINE
jgi:hypothetical protein